MKTPAVKKSEETRTRILDAALALFRDRGFERTTMREIAGSAHMAVGAAYYYFDSKEAIVLAFYERAQAEMLPGITESLDRAKTLEARLRAVIERKFEYFAPNRRLSVMGGESTIFPGLSNPCGSKAFFTSRNAS